METQVLEGTFAEVKIKLNTLPMKPETKMRVIITDMGKTPSREEVFFANAPRRNGLIMSSASGLTTTEEVNEALYRADMEDGLGEDWEQIIQTSSASNNSEVPAHD